MAKRTYSPIDRGARVGIVRDPSFESFLVRGPSDVHAHYKWLGDLAQEELWVVALDTKGAVINDRMISRGGLASSIVEPRAVFQYALLVNAAAIVVMHNHPSGNPEPSAEDVAVTRQLVESGRVLGIPVRDHLIITSRDFTSLAERGCV
jgi:DNA repair protein RadC